MTGTAWVPAGAMLALVLGLVLLRGGQGVRQRRGLGAGKTMALDDTVLTSRRYGLTGKPDRLLREGRTIVPEEWKSSRSLRRSYVAQIGCYFVLVEDCLGERPPHGFVVLGDGTRQRVENTAELRSEVLELAARIREARRRVGVPIPVTPRPGQCRACGMREHCGQARL